MPINKFKQFYNQWSLTLNNYMHTIFFLIFILFFYILIVYLHTHQIIEYTFVCVYAVWLIHIDVYVYIYYIYIHSIIKNYIERLPGR